MSNGIYGYNASRINAYRPVEKPADGARDAAATRTPQSQAGSSSRVSLGADLSTDETRMITQNFPPAPQLTLRLYGPGRQAQSVNPNGIGSRLDIKG